MKESRKPILTLLAIVLLTVAASNSKVISCPDYFLAIGFESFESKDATVLERIKRDLAAGASFHSECPTELVRHGMLSSAEHLISHFILPNKINIEQSFRFMANSLKAKYDGIHRFALNSGKRITVSPALKWGQSYEEVLVFVKFAHRIDSPGCNEVFARTASISQDNELRLEAQGILAGTPINFNLSVPLFERVIKDSIEVKNAGVGAVILEIKKVRHGIWHQLHKQGSDHSRVTASVWWDLKGAKFDGAMEAFRKLHKQRDQRDDEGIWKTKPRREERRGFFWRFVDAAVEGLVWAKRSLLRLFGK